ncbi:MAG: DUF1570 domain-containing protein [Planctomycetes bacterium]|nr:DUF1570 domain-containing protein [Planctomycetota bacterium]
MASVRSNTPCSPAAPRWRRAVFGCVAATTLLVGVAAQATTVRRSKHFQLVCEMRDDLFADDAMAVLDQVWALAERHFQPTAKAGTKKLAVRVYSDRRRYAAAAVRHRMPWYAKFQGFADGRTLTAHVMMVDAAWWTEAGMDPGNRQTLAHEAAHLMVMLCTQSRGSFLPKWVAEGFPMWVEGEVMRAGGWAKSRVADPIEGLRVQQARALVAAGTFPKVAAMLRDDWGKLTELDKYHPIRMLWILLAERHEVAHRALLETLRDTTASAALPAIFASRLKSALGEDAWQKLDAELLAFVAAREVAPYPAPAPLPVDVVGKPGDAQFVPGSPAVRWQGSSTAKSYSISATLTMQPGGMPQSDLVFGRIANQWLRVSLVAGAGVYLMGRREAPGKPGPWQVLAAVRGVDQIVTGKPISVKLWGRGQTVTCSIDSKKVLEQELKDWRIQGKWGVGGPRGSVASWVRPVLR